MAADAACSHGSCVHMTLDSTFVNPVFASVEQGQPIPGIKDIDDKPPNPDQAIAEGKMKPRPKPWERAAQVSHFLFPFSFSFMLHR